MAAVAAGKAKKGPHLDSITVDGQKIRVRYTEVNGKLSAQGRVTGFSIANAEGQMQPLIYKVTLDPLDSSAVLLHFQGKLPEGLTLSYGAGRDPIANLRDGWAWALSPLGRCPLSRNGSGAQRHLDLLRNRVGMLLHELRVVAFHHHAG